MITFLALLALTQDTPVDIAKKDLPKLAQCLICTAGGEAHGEEKPAAGVRYKGKDYFFCSAKEVATFKSSPEFYMPLTFPMPLPELGLSDTSGKVWNKAAFQDRVVLLDYWATWCKPCLELKPKIDRLRIGTPGLEVLSISIDSKKPTMEAFLKKNPWDNPVAFDDKESWVKLRIVSIPALFLVKNGQVIAEFRGKVDVAKLEKAVKAAF